MNRTFRNILQYILINIFVFGIWEFLQTPFYGDWDSSFSEILYNRLHCTVGDLLILSAVITIWSLFKREVKWLSYPKRIDYIAITLLGVLYTGYSEIRNVSVLKSWSYSQTMPLFPGTEIGIIPIVQWLVLPTIIIYFTGKLMIEKYKITK